MQSTHDIFEKSAAAKAFHSANANITQISIQWVCLTKSAYEGLCKTSTSELSLKTKNS